MTTAYEVLGEAKIRAILQALYDQLFVDPMVGFLFEGKDKAHIVAQQVLFTCAFLGGPQRYTGKPLPEAHAALPLHVLATLLDRHGVPDEAKRTWLRIDESLRPSVLAAGAEAREKTRE
jgi:truncated hemoglobin YjbI